MAAAFRSELVRLAQPRLLGAWFGLTALFAVLVNVVLAGFLGGAGPIPPSGPGVTFPTTAELESPTGILAGLAAAANLLGIVSLSFWAVNAAGDYSSGLVRLLVTAEPRRWPLLVGKVGALLVATLGATVVAVVAGLAAAPPALAAAGIDTSAWATDLPRVIADAGLHLFLALAGWGILGLVVAILARSAGVAIAAGIGYVLVFETLLTALPDLPTERLLGSTFAALAKGGTPIVAFDTALVQAAAYVILGLAAATVVVLRRDVTD